MITFLVELAALMLLLAWLPAWIISGIKTWLAQKKCDHPAVREDQACDAWCTKCGKNLGFIGSLAKPGPRERWPRPW